jgi:hypothetical protein
LCSYNAAADITGRPPSDFVNSGQPDVLGEQISFSFAKTVS